MDINKMIESKYLKAIDLDDEMTTMVIDRLDIAEFEQGAKPVLFFEREGRGLVLNKTNTRAIGTAYGYETDAWIGKRVILFRTTVNFQGSRIDAIRVKIPADEKVQDPAPL